jgi:F0F1-type ATP synthase delta subunit
MALKGKLYVAGPFGEEQLGSLKARFKSLLGDEVSFDVVRDEHLIGGFLAFVDGKVYDASMSSRMKGVLHYLTGSE